MFTKLGFWLLKILKVEQNLIRIFYIRTFIIGPNKNKCLHIKYMENNLILKESGAYKTKSTIFLVWVFRCQPEIDEYEDGQQEAEKGHRIPNLETCVKWSWWLLPSRICVPKVLKADILVEQYSLSNLWISAA